MPGDLYHRQNNHARSCPAQDAEKCGDKVRIAEGCRPMAFFLNDLLGTINFYSMASDQKPLCIHAIRRAGNQCNIIPITIDREVGYIFGVDCFDPIDLIREIPSKYMKIKDIPLVQLVKISKHSCGRKASVRGNERMCTLAADREAAACQVPCPLIQNIIRRIMIHRKLYLNHRNFDCSHDAVTVQVQEIFIFRELLSVIIAERLLNIGSV